MSPDPTEGLRIRQVRARIFADIANAPTGLDSRTRCAEHLEAPDQALHSVQVLDLLLRCRQVGAGYARKMLRRARVDGSRAIGALSPRERDQLYEQLTQIRPHEDVTSTGALVA